MVRQFFKKRQTATAMRGASSPEVSRRPIRYGNTPAVTLVLMEPPLLTDDTQRPLASGQHHTRAVDVFDTNLERVCALDEIGSHVRPQQLDGDRTAARRGNVRIGGGGHGRIRPP